VSLILSWVLFPLVLAAIGAGWGAVVERASGSPVSGVLLIPLGLAAVIVFTLLFTEWSVTAPATTPVIVVVALAGLLTSRPMRRVTRWPLIAAIGILLVYGAPVLLSGSATFLGYIRLDDTASFLDLIDHAMTHLHSVGGAAPSTYTLVFTGDAGPTYPLGAFMLLAVGHALTGIDAAWIAQPYLACCGVAVGLGVYALVQPLVSSPRIRALVAFLAAQPALLYGYSLWGGQKELTAAFLLVLGAALLAEAMLERPPSPRGLLPVAFAAAALILTLGVGAAAFVVPALLVAVIAWARRSRPGERRAVARDVGLLSAMTAVLALPVWITLSEFLDGRIHGLFSSGTHTAEESLGNLIQPLSGWQLAGIWPVGDFRVRVSILPSALLIGLVVIAAVATIWITLRRRQPSIAVYVAVTLIGCVIYYLIGATPWVTGKALAMSSPALLAAALAGGGMLWSRWRRHRAAGLAGMIVVALLAGGVLWSNALAYHDVKLAPRARLAELQRIGELVAGKGPTFINEYEVYADRHFLREGAPVEPAEYRSAFLPLRDGAVLTKVAWADLDSFPLSTIEPYRSIVTPRSPAESRPPSVYRLVWQGRYYQLWQRPVDPATRILEQVPLGESNMLPYCGVAQNGPYRAECSVDPVATASCAQVRGLGLRALAEHARLVAYQRPAPIVARGDQTLWPGAWIHNIEAHTLTPKTPGQAVGHIAVAVSQRYELWLGGSFARGFEVSVDGAQVGTVKNELSPDAGSGYVHVANVFLLAGVHTFTLSYPHADLAPGSGDNELTSLDAIALQPQSPPSKLIEVSPRHAVELCGRPLDWIEIVVPST
jgi:hypothetical protein